MRFTHRVRFGGTRFIASSAFMPLGRLSDFGLQYQMFDSIPAGNHACLKRMCPIVRMFYETHETNGTDETNGTHALRTTAMAFLNLSLHVILAV